MTRLEPEPRRRRLSIFTTIGIVVSAILATCVPLIASNDLHIRWFGLLNLGAVIVLAALMQSAFISLWCAWAAITSTAIAVYLREHAAADGAGRAKLATT